ncbi:MAG: ShlB/FhaC/HecB family hemolysin secretion/activation protein [Burkholderiaceae bacterium]
MALTQGSSWAQQVMTEPAKPVFAIRGFDVIGDNPLSESETTHILAPFLRADATIETLQKATTALETALKARGYGLHRVVLPPQAVGSAVRLDIVKFTIGKVTVDGLARYDEANIRASVPELAEGQAPNFKTLAVQTAIANESQGKQIQIALKESEVADQIDARIVVKESQPWNFATSLANTGARETGRDRLTVSGGHSNLFNLDHQFVGAYTTSIERTSDVRQLGLNYRIPVYRAGGVVGASYTRSTVVGNYGAFTSTGAGQTMGLNYSHYLPPEGGYRGYLNLALDDKRFDITEISGVPVPGQQIRRSRPLTLGYAARVESSAAIWSYNVDLSRNLSGGSGNNLAAYQSEDPRITTSRFTVLRANANYLGLLSGGWLWSVRGQLQTSADALISGEQFGLGGASNVRGTTERPISGDRGLFTSWELSTPELHPGLRLLGFVDAGWLRNNNPNATNKPPSDHLASVGLGLRYNQGHIAVTLDWGRIVTGSVLAASANPTIPRAGNNRLHVNLSARF